MPTRCSESEVELHVEVSYSQLVVVDPRMPSPLNAWSEAHVAQGFAWRPGSVSFGTLEASGDVVVRVIVARLFEAATSTSSRVIAVPFRVAAHGSVEVGSMGGGVEVKLPPGEYELTFEHGRMATGAMWADLYFRGASALDAPSYVAPRIVKADPELSPPATLLMEAEPA